MTRTHKAIQLPVKLHLGCGDKYLPGFTHIDLNRSPNIDFMHSINRLPMFPHNSVDEIYCCHAFEYFSRSEAVSVLHEWNRILKLGGVLRLAVPDFDALATAKEIWGLEAILGPLYGKWKVDGHYIYHKTTYDYVDLAKLLLSCGFEVKGKYDWKEMSWPDGYDDFSRSYLPHIKDCKNYEEYTQGLLISLNVEAVKVK